MQRVAALLSMWCCLFVSTGVLAQVPPDQEIRRLMIGTWVPAIRDKMSITSTSHYRDDGTLEFIAFADAACTKPTLRAFAKWTIESGRLRIVVVRSSDPSIFPSGYVVEDEVLAITANEKTLRGTSGSIQHRAKSTGCLVAQNAA